MALTEEHKLFSCLIMISYSTRDDFQVRSQSSSLSSAKQFLNETFQRINGLGAFYDLLTSSCFVNN